MTARRSESIQASDRDEPNVRHSRRFPDELVEDARRIFQKRTTRTLTNEDARQMLENLTGFFTVLRDMDRARTRREADRNRTDAEDSSD